MIKVIISNAKTFFPYGLGINNEDNEKTDT